MKDDSGNYINSARGENHSRAILTDDDVRLIRELLSERKKHSSEAAKLEIQLSEHKKKIRALSHTKIGEKFGVARKTISSIAYEDNWTHIR